MELDAATLDRIQVSACKEIAFFDFAEAIHIELDKSGFDPCKHSDILDTWYRKLYFEGADVDRSSLVCARGMLLYRLV